MTEVHARGARLWLIVPVKPFAEAKSRLAQILTPDERADLMRRLLKGVLHAVQTSGLFAGMLVVSRDAEVREVAEAYGARPVPEHGNDLNSALEEARRLLPPEADALLVLPADLPDVSAGGLIDFVQHTGLRADRPLVAIAPSVTGGTNALLLNPPNVIAFAFGVEDGVESSDRHARLAIEQGARLVTIHSRALAFDVDLPADYLILQGG